MRETRETTRQARVRRAPVLGHTRNRRLRPRARSSGPASLTAALSRMARRAVAPLLFVALAVTVAAGFAATARFAFRSPRFAVREIRIEGTRHADAEALRRRISMPDGRNLFRVRLADVERDVKGDSWVREARARREFPDRLIVAVTEHRPRALVLLSHLYLVSDEARLFKKATPAEAQGLPVISGLDRLGFIEDRDTAEQRLREALAVLDAYSRPGRARLSEIHLDETGAAGPTLYTYGGAQIRLGADRLAERLLRLDQVWAALGADAAHVRAIFLDQTSRPNRVTVRLGAMN